VGQTAASETEIVKCPLCNFCDRSRKSGLEDAAEGDYWYRGMRNLKFSDTYDVARGICN
jgi:hypothetical protein